VRNNGLNSKKKTFNSTTVHSIVVSISANIVSFSALISKPFKHLFSCPSISSRLSSLKAPMELSICPRISISIVPSSSSILMNLELNLLKGLIPTP
jgi:hypothetical protein